MSLLLRKNSVNTRNTTGATGSQKKIPGTTRLIFKNKFNEEEERNSLFL